jgi:exodeoxyribonuclease VII small subunit
MQRKKKSFENAMDELEEVVRKLEQGEMSLDESLQYFQKGMVLTKELHQKLDDVEKKIALIMENEDGTLRIEEFNIKGEEHGF